MYIGAIPRIRHPELGILANNGLSNIDRPTRKAGHINLRQLDNENLKLSEQLAELGLAHLAAKANSLFDHNPLFWSERHSTR
jgi:hypothetical protein